MRVKNVSGQQTESMEDYLETIVLLKEGGRTVSVTAISKSMGVKKPSVDWALTKLAKAGLVLHEKYGDVKLTAEGDSLAQDVYQRHTILRQFLVDILSVDDETANADACRMEHVLSRTSLSRLETFINFVLKCPHGIPEWLKGFNYYIEHGKRDDELLARCER